MIIKYGILVIYNKKISESNSYHSLSQQDLVLLVVDNSTESLYLELKKVPDLTKMLGHVDGEIFPLYDDEVKFLKSLSDCGHVVEISTGLIENDEVQIVSGPLKGREGIIRKIDRHKRVALIEVELFGKTTQAKVGLEIVSKT